MPLFSLRSTFVQRFNQIYQRDPSARKGTLRHKDAKFNLSHLPALIPVTCLFSRMLILTIVHVQRFNQIYQGLYGYHQRKNTGSRLFTEVKPCWTGLISGWVTISIKIPCAVLLGKSGWRSGHQSRLPPLLQCCMWIEFSVDLNLTSRVSSGHSGFLPPQN